MSSGHLHPQYNLRWPEELRDKISQSAKQNNRSMNSEIVLRLMESFSPNKHHPFHGVEIGEVIETTQSNDALLKSIHALLEQQNSQNSKILKALERVHKSEQKVKEKAIEAITGSHVEIVDNPKQSDEKL